MAGSMAAAIGSACTGAGAGGPGDASQGASRSARYDDLRAPDRLYVRAFARTQSTEKRTRLVCKLPPTCRLRPDDPKCIGVEPVCTEQTYDVVVRLPRFAFANPVWAYRGRADTAPAPQPPIGGAFQ